MQQFPELCAHCRQDISDEDNHTCPQQQERSEHERREWMHTNDDDLEEQRTW